MTQNVSVSQLFVRGVVNQEEQKEVSYPKLLHCVFCGARGLFMDCLIRSTSALIVVSVALWVFLFVCFSTLA